MTTRRKITLRAYDYNAAHFIVVGYLQKAGEATKLTPTEMCMVTQATEIAADRGMTSEKAEGFMREVAAEIMLARGQTLFQPYDENDNMGDCSTAPAIAVQEARKAVA